MSTDQKHQFYADQLASDQKREADALRDMLSPAYVKARRALVAKMNGTAKK